VGMSSMGYNWLRFPVSKGSSFGIQTFCFSLIKEAISLEIVEPPEGSMLDIFTLFTIYTPADRQ